MNEYLDELEVHPPGAYQRLKDLCIASARELLSEQGQWSDVSCPGCASPERQPAFEKHGYTYWSCERCSTVYVSPRPSEAQMDWYLLRSPAAAFRNSADYRQALRQHAGELASYRAAWISEVCQRMTANLNCSVIDVETRSLEYLTRLQKLHLGPVIAVNPLFEALQPQGDQGAVPRVVKRLTELEGADCGLVAAFDILEHLVHPQEFARNAHRALGPGGLLVITSRCSSGFDIQVLWDQCTTIFPAEHINLLSVEGVKALLTGSGFDIVEASTPGQLDVQMIERALHEQEDAEVPRFLSYFLRFRDRLAKHRLQQFLQQNLLSSHLRVVARKVADG